MVVLRAWCARQPQRRRRRDGVRRAWCAVGHTGGRVDRRRPPVVEIAVARATAPAEYVRHGVARVTARVDETFAVARDLSNHGHAEIPRGASDRAELCHGGGSRSGRGAGDVPNGRRAGHACLRPCHTRVRARENGGYLMRI